MYESVIKSLEKEYAEAWKRIPESLRKDLESIRASIEYLKMKDQKGERI